MPGGGGAAVVGIASAERHLVYKSRYCYVSTILMNLSTPRNTLWVRTCIQALTRHTNMICGAGEREPVGTEQQLLSPTLAMPTRLRGHLPGFRKEVLTKPNQGSGMEPRWEGDREGRACFPDKANEIVLYLLSR
jgi:hypothetical protein